MSLTRTSPPMFHSLRLAEDEYNGIEHINKFGSSVNVTSNTVEDVWDAGGTYSFPATALMTHVSQTTDQAAARGSSWTIEGLTADYAEVTQTVTLDGTNSTTLVALATPLFRVNLMYMTTNITLTSTVRLHNAGETIDYADIQVDHNQSLNAIYTVPLAKTAYITVLTADYAPTAAKNPDSVHYHMQVRRNATSEGWRVIKSFAVTPGNSSFNRVFDPPLHLPAKTDIRVTAIPSGKDAHVHCSFDIILIEDS